MFYSELAGKSDPEAKRKTIGRLFIDVFQSEATQVEGVELLGQGTIYPDVIESVSVHGPSVTIKSHHNVGGLPEKMHLELVEPLRYLFKDEVRRVGAELGIPEEQLQRHPFPGPGLAIRILGEVTPEKVRLLQDADEVFVRGLKEHHLYSTVWQAGAILLPVKSVGVMGDERTYEFTVALRAVTSVDGMTADWAHLPYTFLADISNEIINSVKGINRVVYDIQLNRRPRLNGNREAANIRMKISPIFLCVLLLGSRVHAQDTTAIEARTAHARHSVAIFLPLYLDSAFDAARQLPVRQKFSQNSSIRVWNFMRARVGTGFPA